MPNPLIDERDLLFQINDVLRAKEVLTWPNFTAHDDESCLAFIRTALRFGREVLFPSYRVMDEQPPVLKDGKVLVHHAVKQAWPTLTELGVIAATRPLHVGGSQLPHVYATAATLGLMAGNLSIYGYAGLTAGAAHLIEAFGTDALKQTYLAPMYEGRWTGTMALTEPQAGSSLADVRTRATLKNDVYLISGSKIFISGGEQDLTENIVHLVLARIDGAPAGTRGISLFAVPKLRPSAAGLVPNDVRATGLIHKIGWRGLPSLALNFGEAGDCHGFLVGKANDGLKHMFQMMNEARLMVGANAVATASVAFHEALAYARDRTQGRPATQKDATKPAVPILEHADVRRQLLRQKAIVEGGLALVLRTARLVDEASHASTEEQRADAQRLLDVLTPITKTFPAERGFEANALAVQVHGGYGYSSEYLPEAWLRDQKLNSLHEGTTGIQGLDLLGRKVVAEGGAGWRALRGAVDAGCARATQANVATVWIDAVRLVSDRLESVTLTLGAKGMEGDVDGMLLHSADYLEAVSTWVIAWQWLEQLAAVHEARERTPFHEGKVRAAHYWLSTELPRCDVWARLCLEGEPSYGEMKAEWW